MILTYQIIIRIDWDKSKFKYSIVELNLDLMVVKTIEFIQTFINKFGFSLVNIKIKCINDYST